MAGQRRPPSTRRPGRSERRRTGFEAWWPVVFGATRDLASLATGIFILLFRPDASQTLQLIAFACLGVTASGVAARLLERIVGGGNGNGGRKRG